ncbi:MAG: UDP-N-acetylmuramoyl-L-alanine--D-glutamate ligase [Patescibacteria group bacterium]|nr:UDP-N-acetylmuramoyl-L-alanine--D-glutamate ligase [Patescibacteria group bacterium]
MKDKIKFLQNKKIAMLGLGVENLALVKFLLKNKIDCHISICDPKPAAELGDRFLEIKELARKNKMPEINLMAGKNYDAHLADFDIVFRSPGYPLFNPNLVKATKAGVQISSPMRLFFVLCPTKNIIGVTGSKGKGTTSSLIFEIIKKSGKKSWLGGNIGTAPFDFIEKIKPKDFVVLELSSFQLEDLDISPRIAVVTNLFKEHLAPADPNNPNYHRSMKAYSAAKANIFCHQKKDDWVVANESLKSRIPLFCHSEPRARNLFQSKNINRSLANARDDKKRVVFYGKSELASNLTGEHNKENVAAAESVAKILHIKPAIVASAVKKFQGLPHRLEFVAEINGVKYFDDSFATVPDVSVIALKSFAGGENPPRRAEAARHPSREGNIILLAGGADKGSDFKNFAKEIKKRVKYLILFKGKGTERIKYEIRNTKYEIRVSEVDNMKDAVLLAKKNSKSGDIVLLSTGCASFGCFKNYKERGDQFKTEVINKK